MEHRWTIEKIPRGWRVTHWHGAWIEDMFEMPTKRKAKRFKNWLCSRHGYTNSPCVKVRG